VPTADNTYDLGSPTNMWKDIYVGPGSLYVNGQKVLQDESGAIVVSADINENLGLRTSGSGNIELDPTGTGVVNVKGPLVIQAATNITSADGNAVTFGGAVNADSISSKTANTDLSITANGTGKVYLNDNAEVSGNLVVGGNLTVSGTTTTVNSETISLADNLIDLNSNFTTGTPTENSGIRVLRGDSPTVQMRWNESTDAWEFTNDGTAYSSIAPVNSPTFTGTVSGITKTMVGLGSVDNTADADKPVSTATQTALDAKLASATAATTYETITNVALKAPLESPTFTGTVSGVTKTHVGLENVDNTADADKPVSDDTQAALDLKADLEGPTFTGTVDFSGATVTGLPAAEFVQMTTVSVSSNVTLESNKRYFVDTAAARTLTLPASPANGDEVQIFDVVGSAATNSIIVDSNTLKINGTVQNLEIDIDYDIVALVYTGSTYGWVVL
jgi:hypothetical protein